MLLKKNTEGWTDARHPILLFFLSHLVLISIYAIARQTLPSHSQLISLGSSPKWNEDIFWAFTPPFIFHLLTEGVSDRTSLNILPHVPSAITQASRCTQDTEIIILDASENYLILNFNLGENPSISPGSLMLVISHCCKQMPTLSNILLGAWLFLGIIFSKRDNQINLQKCYAHKVASNVCKRVLYTWQ